MKIISTELKSYYEIKTDEHRYRRFNSENWMRCVDGVDWIAVNPEGVEYCFTKFQHDELMKGYDEAP